MYKSLKGALPNLINFYYFLKDNFFVCEIVMIVVERKWASHTRSWVYGQGQTWMEPFIIKYTFFVFVIITESWSEKSRNLFLTASAV